MKKLIIIYSYFIYSIQFAKSQAPVIEWQKCYGGSSGDALYSTIQTLDHGYALLGSSNSNDGDVNGNHGGGDVWLVKIDSVGGMEWQSVFGGTGNEVGWSILQTSDSGYIFTGGTNSNDYDVTGNHGIGDAWVVKTDSLGNIIWQKCYGGTSGESAYSINKTLDNGYILCGFTASNDGDVSGLHGTTETDIWVIKIDGVGTLQWQKCLGGMANDGDLSSANIASTSDSGYIVTGGALSFDGDVSGNHGSHDYWVVKLNSTGIIQWQNCLGGSSSDKSFSIIQSDDGGYVVAGYAYSTDNGLVSHGGGDYWVVKLDSGGSMQWQKCYGGSEWDRAYNIQKSTDGGYLVMGQTYSYNGDVVGHHGLSIGLDYWLIKIDSTGDLLWQKCLGGTSEDFGHCLVQTSDSGYLVGGGTFSNDGDVSGNHGGSGDYWIAKLVPLGTQVPETKPISDFSVYLNSENSTATISFESEENKETFVEILDVTGKILQSQKLKMNRGYNKHEIKVGEIPNGVYIIILKTNGMIFSEKLVLK
jgi:hypothetical protein